MKTATRTALELKTVCQNLLEHQPSHVLFGVLREWYANGAAAVPDSETFTRELRDKGLSNEQAQCVAAEGVALLEEYVAMQQVRSRLAVLMQQERRMA